MSENEREKEFLKRLWATFKVEADEHIKAISSGLLELEKSPPPIRKSVLSKPFIAAPTV
jgi:two-component system, chemotaxis family, sensor kinase CheA